MDNFFSLYCAQVGKSYKIKEIKSPQKIKRRLFELGLCDCYIKLLKKGGENGACLLEVRDYVLAVKTREVKNILVTE